MDTHTTEQLLMCEKADLVKYIEELRGEVRGWIASRDDDIREAEGSMRDELEELQVEVRDYDHKLEFRDKMIDELKKWSLSKDMIESTSAETIEEFEKDVRDNWTELENLQERNEELSEEVERCEEETIPKEFLTEYLREDCKVAIDVDVLKNHLDEIERLKKELEEVKYSKWSLGATLETAVASRLSAWFPEELMGEDEIAENADMSKVDGDTLVKMIDSYTKYCIEKTK